MKQKRKGSNFTPELSIIIPVFNEPVNIVKTLGLVKKRVTTSFEVLVVYDSDSDTTVPVLQKLKKSYKNLIIVKNDVKAGPSGAIRTGIKNARAERILVTMADLCDDLSQVNQLMRIVPEDADIACPSRYCKGGKQNLDSSFKVGLPKLAGILLRALTGIPTFDPTNSYKMYSAKLLQSLTLKSSISFSVTLEIMAKSHYLGFRIVEIPTTWHDRQHGKTNFKIWQSLISYTPWFCLAVLRNRLFVIPPSLLRRWLTQNVM